MYVPPGKRQEQQRQEQQWQQEQAQLRVDAHEKLKGTTVQSGSAAPPTDSQSLVAGYDGHALIESSCDERSGPPQRQGQSQSQIASTANASMVSGGINGRWERGLTMRSTRPTNAHQADITANGGGKSSSDIQEDRSTKATAPLTNRNDGGRSSWRRSGSSQSIKQSGYPAVSISTNANADASSLFPLADKSDPQSKSISNASLTKRVTEASPGIAINVHKAATDDCSDSSVLYQNRHLPNNVWNAITHKSEGQLSVEPISRSLSRSGIDQLESAMSKMGISGIPLSRNISEPLSTSKGPIYTNRHTDQRPIKHGKNNSPTARLQLPLDPTGAETRVLELTGIPTTLKHADIRLLLSDPLKRPGSFTLHNSTDTSAYAVFPTSAAARMAYHYVKDDCTMKVVPYVEMSASTLESPLFAPACRPVTTDMAARRLISGALGIRTPKKSQAALEEDRRKMQDARLAKEKKLQVVERAQEDSEPSAWDA
ncbi:hypothetical protein BASA50_008209 [Batrachochytrium salamandrivorans]|uniref:RRM domain-containing protein n=1 Tax=Batrachochytrium salamandrivorans TaxID=1357716 RepID=A0ABQ8F4W0_9FUNG|nr:hypothetical protein BASA50_008209 [Batrachochytrium salamandrivorans]KAH9274746.1 hypothetical protein BASA83_002951 [Batrachochytrium salamandrivorans]